MNFFWNKSVSQISGYHNVVRIDDFPIFRFNYDNNFDRNIDLHEKPKILRHWPPRELPISPENRQIFVIEILTNAYRVPWGCNIDSRFVFFVALLCNKYTRADPAPYLGMNYVIGLIKLSKYSSRLTPRGNFHIFIHWHIDRAATFMPI